jgi:signal transduction histidine kinase
MTRTRGTRPRVSERTAALRTGPLRTGSLRARTVVAILVLLVLLLGLLAVTVETTLGTRLRAQIEDRLRDRASAAAALVGTVDATDLADRLSMQGLSVRIVQADGASVEAGPTPAQLRTGPPDPASLPGPAAKGTATGTSGGAATGTSGGTVTGTPTTTARIASSTIRQSDGIVTLVSRLSDGSTITLTAGTESVDQTLAELRWVMAGASAGFLLLATAGVVLVVRRSLRPLDDMTDTARAIASGDRARRLRPARTDTEIGRTAAAFDEMLDAVAGAEEQAVAAESRMRAFVSDAAHELRTPVAGIRAAADAMVRAPLTVAERDHLAANVVRQADRTARLVDDMLMMTRLDRGLTLDLRPVDLGDFVVAEADRLRLRLPGITLTTRVPDGPAPVLADADRLAQVVGNLVDNAARATGGHGTVRIVAETSDRDDSVVLRVEDDGPGIPPADRERVFDRLVRLDTARDDRSGGAGLGLPIARGIARAHGGDLVCDGGTAAADAVFVLTLPAAAPATATPDGPGSAHRVDGDEQHAHPLREERDHGERVEHLVEAEQRG